jgi:hypothetical protein
MRIRHGLTTWILCIGRIAIIWRWNMSRSEAVKTFRMRLDRRGHGYATAGPLVLEW